MQLYNFFLLLMQRKNTLKHLEKSKKMKNDVFL